MPSYQITEPHPTALPNHYMHTGRGGAGNTIRAPARASSPSSSSSTKTSSTRNTTSSSTSTSTSSTTRHYTGTGKASTGRGGAGNIHSAASLSHFSLADEMDAQVAREAGHDTWHVGRGGAGNFASLLRTRKMSESSDASGASVRSGFLGRLSGAFDRR